MCGEVRFICEFMNSIGIKVYHFTRILVLLLLVFGGKIVCYAQFENTTWRERIGHGRDSVVNIEHQMVWTRYANENASVALAHSTDMSVKRSWDFNAYRAWYALTHGSARFSVFSLYASGLGGDMLRYLMHHEKDAAVKLNYFDDLMWLSDFRIQHLDELNSLPDYGPISKSTLGDVKTWKAHYYYTEGRSLPTAAYDKLKAYNLFADAMKTVRQQKSVNGTEVEAFLLEEYFNACYDLYKSDPERYKVQFLSDYLDCANTCKRLYEAADEKSSKEEAERQFAIYYNEYVRVIQPLFTSTGVGNPDSLDAYFRRHFDANKNDLDYVNTAVALMLQNDCMPTMDANRCVEQYAEVAYAHPEKMNYFSALAYGLKMNKDAALQSDSTARQQKRVAMRAAFEKAFEYASTPSDKAEVSLQIGKALNQKMDETLAGNVAEVERWKSDMDGVIKYFEDAISYDAAHYAVVANYNLELVYRNLVLALNNNAFLQAHTQDERYAIRKDQLEYANASIECANKVAQEAVKAYDNHVYEQDGMYLNDLASYAQSNAPVSTAKQLQDAVKSYKTRYEKVSSTGRGGTKVDENWHQHTWHPYLAKKGAEQRFWGGKGVTCKYCGRNF